MVAQKATAEKARMKIQKWLEAKGLSLKQLAETLGCDKSQVTRWAAGTQVPRKKTIIAIQKLTQNAVRPEDWYAR